MPLTERDEDWLLSLAFSFHNNPGAYALLLGAGVSMPEVPSAWGILMDLVAKKAEASGESPGDPLQWYRERHNGEDPTYEGFLEEMAQTQDERQRMLLDYFEPPEGRVPQPTATHRAVARLVAAGTVRVILTLNFDKLLERALNDAGITPTVVETPHKLGRRLPPLHTIRCCLVHVHGDYLSPMSMLNTEEELRKGYHPALTTFLRQVLENYGLVIAGWSSKYDPTLRELIRDESSGRYTTAWVEPNEPTAEAIELLGLMNGRMIKASASEAFGYVADALESLNTAKRNQHPLSVTTAAETAKRELGGGTVSISLHDVFHTQLERLAATSELTFPEDAQESADRLKEIGGLSQARANTAAACRVPAALASCIAYWGYDAEQTWLRRAITRFSFPMSSNPSPALSKMSLIAGKILFYAGGVSAVAAGRFGLLVQLLKLERPHPLRGEVLEPLTKILFDSRPADDLHLMDLLAPVLQESLALGPETVESAWEDFEILRLAYVLITHEDYPEVSAGLANAIKDYQDAASKGDDMQGQFAAPFQSLLMAFGNLARRAPSDGLHIRVAQAAAGEPYSPTAMRMSSDQELHTSLIAAGLSESERELRLVFQGVSYSVQLAAVNRRAEARNPDLYRVKSGWLDQPITSPRST